MINFKSVKVIDGLMWHKDLFNLLKERHVKLMLILISTLYMLQKILELNAYKEIENNGVGVISVLIGILPFFYSLFAIAGIVYIYKREFVGKGSFLKAIWETISLRVIMTAFLSFIIFLIFFMSFLELVDPLINGIMKIQKDEQLNVKGLLNSPEFIILWNNFPLYKIIIAGLILVVGLVISMGLFMFIAPIMILSKGKMLRNMKEGIKTFFIAQKVLIIPSILMVTLMMIGIYSSSYIQYNGSNNFLDVFFGVLIQAYVYIWWYMLVAKINPGLIDEPPKNINQ